MKAMNILQRILKMLLTLDSEKIENVTNNTNDFDVSPIWWNNIKCYTSYKFSFYFGILFQSGVSGSVLVMADIDAKIKAQGDKIRELKAAKSSKDVIDPEVKTLLGLKAEFKVQYILSAPFTLGLKCL